MAWRTFGVDLIPLAILPTGNDPSLDSYHADRGKSRGNFIGILKYRKMKDFWLDNEPLDCDNNA